MSVCAKNFCFSSVKILVNACSRCDSQEVLGASGLRLLLEMLGSFWMNRSGVPHHCLC